LKIRTRLLFFLLPLLIGGISLVSILSLYHLKEALSEEQFHDSLFLIFGGALLTILLTVLALYWIADRLTRPVHKLNSSALAIAAGQYGQSIEVKGPKELVEFANTLNTMSECLLENINRLKDNSLLKERVQSEYECCRLLQHLMLQKNIDECRSDAFAVKPISFFSENPRGFLLDFPKNESGLSIHLREADQPGFEGMYQLLASYKDAKKNEKQTSFLLDRGNSILHFEGSHTPLLWSMEEKRWKEFHPKNNKVESGDFLFLFNQGTTTFYRTQERLTEILSKVLKIFDQDGLEIAAAMLQKEIAFTLRRKDLEEDLHLLCFQFLNL